MLIINLGFNIKVEPLKQKLDRLLRKEFLLNRILLLAVGIILLSAELANAQGLLRVKEIKIHGNENFSNGKIKGEMNIKSAGFPSFLRRGSEFNARILRLDRTSIRKFYESNGYIYVEITDSIEIVNRKDIIIHLNINEGKQIKISEINIRGNDLIADTEILRMFESKLGKPLNPYLLRKDLATIRAAYQARGKPYAQFRNEFKGDNDITVVIDVIENETVFIDSIIVLGTQKVNSSIVMRELEINPNEKYNIDYNCYVIIALEFVPELGIRFASCLISSSDRGKIFPQQVRI